MPYRAKAQAYPFSTQTEKTPSKESVEKAKKMEGLLRTLTANRPLAEAVRFELTCP